MVDSRAWELERSVDGCGNWAPEGWGLWGRIDHFMLFSDITEAAVLNLYYRGSERGVNYKFSLGYPKPSDIW